MTDWTVEIPNRIEVSGFGAAPGQGAVRTEMDSGYAYQRQRYSATVENIRGAMTIDKWEYTDFLAFHKGLASGALPFASSHPVTGVAAQLRFDVSSPPSFSALSGTLFKVSLSLEVLP